VLDLLIQGFREQFCLDEDGRRIRDRLREEHARLLDADYLQSEVIGQSRWAWDFESLSEGFSELVGPFMDRDSGISHIYLQALREFGDFRPEHENIIVILEYAYFASLIEDYYSFHDAFCEPDPAPRRCSRLTQVKFAGQYLGLYPRHLLIRNALKVDENTLIRTHRWIKNIYITWGISRGVLLKWIGARMNRVSQEQYFQNSINALCTYFLSPIIMGAIIAGWDEGRVQQLKEAVSWLTLSIKLRCERRAILGQLVPDLDEYHRKALLPITLPGTSFLQRDLGWPEAGNGLVTLAALHQQMLAKVRSGWMPADLAWLEDQEHRFFGLFTDRMRQIGGASGLVARLAGCLGKEKVIS